jgi:serine/threonine protein kinase
VLIKYETILKVQVDVWSYGVVTWELLTCDIPYKDVDSGAILWGVGNCVLRLPIPESAPAGLKLLINQCWSQKPRNRPSFAHILRHLEIARAELQNYSPGEWAKLQERWRAEVSACLDIMKRQGQRQNAHTNNNNSVERKNQVEEELIKRRREELRHAQDVRELLEHKLRRVSGESILPVYINSFYRHVP